MSPHLLEKNHYFCRFHLPQELHLCQVITHDAYSNYYYGSQYDVNYEDSDVTTYEGLVRLELRCSAHDCLSICF